jgi:hypothetical protein
MSALNRSTGVKQVPSTDALRNFYFSGATNYTAFKHKAEKSDLNSSVTSQNQSEMPSPAADRTSTQAGSPPTPSVAAGSAMKLVKSTTAAASASTVGRPSSGAPNVESVSPEYINFLRQQQDLVKSHNAITEALKAMLSIAGTHKADHLNANGGALRLLHEAEQSTDWHWKSRFNLEGLCKDAELEVPMGELCAADTIPRIADLQHQHQQLIKLKQDHPEAQPFQLVIENGIRRFERLMKEFDDSQLNAEQVTRLSDTLMVQLDHVMTVQPLKKVLQDIDDQISVITTKRKQCQGTRDQALEDGAMDVAERESYRLADLSEELVAAQIERIRILANVAQDHAVTARVRDEYASKAADDTSLLSSENAALRGRCEEDLAKLYKLRRLADDTEQQQSEKWAADRAASDQRLDTIARRQTEAWEQIEMLLKQVVGLEDERHQEAKRRVQEKVKDESRRNEYKVFRTVADGHAATLDRTVKNCDIHIHCAKLMHEFVTTGFNSIQRYISQCKEEVDTELLAARKKHLDVYRGLLFTLGDLEYKKGKRIDEVSENVQAAHIQQELCSDSLNPNAKKFSDAKRELLRVRDELDLELADVRERQRLATEQFEPTEAALVEARVEHQHPVEELAEWRLSTRAKMVEYRAMSLGHASSAPLEAELDALRRTFNESKRLTQRSRGNASGSTVL